MEYHLWGDYRDIVIRYYLRRSTNNKHQSEPSKQQEQHFSM